MLGLGSTSPKGGGMAKISKKGLQLWHKYNVSNAPYGEDIVENGRFNLGADKVVDGSFDDTTVSSYNTGKALSFNGTSDYVDLGSNLELGTSDFTLALFFKKESSSDQRLLDKRGSTGWTLYSNSSDQLALELNDGTGYAIWTLTTALDLNAIHRVVVSADRSGNATCYVNGVAHTPVDISSKSGSLDSTSNLFIGTDAPSGGGLYLKGMMSDVQIYNSAWTSSDVTFDYNNPNALVIEDVRPEILGEDLVDNGGFEDGATGWTTNAGSTQELIGKTLKMTSASAANDLSSVDAVGTNGSVYEFTLDASNFSAGTSTGYLRLNGVYDATNIISFFSGSNTVRFTSYTDFTFIKFFAQDSNLTYTISNISVKEVTQFASHLTASNLSAYYALSEGSGNKIYDSTGLGTELVVDGNFPTGTTAWTEGDGWTIGTGTLNASNTTPASDVYQPLGVIGLAYKVTYSITSYTSGSVAVKCGAGTVGVSRSSVGTYTETLTMATNQVIAFSGVSFIGSIDNISVKEVKADDGTSIGATWVDQQATIPQLGLMDWSKGSNFIEYSEDFSGSYWGKHTSGIDAGIGTDGINPNVSISPNGSLNADRVNFLLQSDRDIGLGKSISSSSGVTWSASIWVKGEGDNIGKDIRLRMKRSSGGTYVGENLDIELTSGWVRHELGPITLVTDNNGVRLNVSSNDATNCLIWGAQLEQSSTVGSYIGTNGSAASNATLVQNPNDLGKDVLGNTLTLKGDKNFNIPDGTITLNSDWKLNAGWSVDDGVVSSNGSATAISQDDVLTIDTHVSITVTVTGNPSLLVFNSASFYDDLTSRKLINGTNSYILKAESSDFGITNAGGDACTISNISVKELAGWSNVSETGGAISVNTLGGIDITTGATNSNEGKVAQVFTTEADREYELTLTTVDLITADLGTSSTGSQISSTDLTSGISTITFTASTSTTYLTFRNFDNTNGTSNVNNVSLKQIVNSVHDYSKNENGGVLYTGKALEFDGTGDYVELGDTDLDGEFTIAINYNVADELSDNGLFGDKTTDDNLSIQSGGTSLRFRIGGSSTAFTFSEGTPDTWYRLVLTRDSSDVIRCYKNNVLSGVTVTDAGTFTINNIGAGYSGWMFNGLAADYQLYDKAWTATDVKYDWEHPEKDVFDDIDRPEVLGAELISNGTFDSNSSTGWSLGSGWSIGGNKASQSGSIDFLTYNDFNPTIGKTYTVQYEITDYTSGLVYLSFGGSYLVYYENTVDTFTYDITATSTAKFGIYSGASTTLSIDNISVKEITQHASTILPTDCKALYRLNEGYGDKVYNSATVLGVELVENGDFTTDEDIWSPYDGANINDTVPEALYLPNGGGHVTQSILESGKHYYYVVVAKSGTSTLSDMNLTSGGLGGQIIIEDVPTNYTTYTGIIASNGTGFLLGEGSGGSLIVDSISLKQITPASTFQSYTNATTAGATWVNAQRDIPQLGMVSYSKKMIFGGDSSDDYVEVTSNSAINMGDGDFTLSCVALVNSDTGESQRLIDKRGSSYGYNLSYFYSSGDSNGKIKLEMRDGTSPVLNVNISDDPLPLGELASIIASFDRSGNVTCYINGVAQTPVDISNHQGSLDTALSLLFGGDADLGTSNNLNGFMDEVSIFNKALTSTEVTELYNAGTALDARDHSESGKLLGYWRNNGTDSWLDLSGSVWTDEGLDESSVGFNWDYDNGHTTIDNSGGKLKISTTDSGITNSIRGFSIGGTQIVGSSTVLGKVNYYKVGDSIDIEVDSDIFNNGNNQGYIMSLQHYSTIANFAILDSEVSHTGDRARIQAVVDDIEYFVDDSFKSITFSNFKITYNRTDTSDGTVNGSPETIILQEGVLFGKDSLGFPMNKVRQKGLNLDGAGYVKVADDNSLDITTTITLEAWIKLDPFVVGNLDHIIGKRTSGLNWCRLYRPAANVIRMEIQAGHHLDIDVVDGEWCHIIGTIDGTTGKLYYNNGDPEEITYGVTFTWDTDIPIGIGAWFNGDSTISTASKTIGTIDEPRVYNRVLSAKEIKKNFKASKAQHKNDNTVSNWSDDFTNDFI